MARQQFYYLFILPVSYLRTVQLLSVNFVRSLIVVGIVFPQTIDISYAAKSATVLASETIQLLRKSKNEPKHLAQELYFRAYLNLLEIRENHSSSSIALRLEQKRVRGIDPDEIERKALQWEAKNKRAALTLRKEQLQPTGSAEQTPITKPNADKRRQKKSTDRLNKADKSPSFKPDIRPFKEPNRTSFLVKPVWRPSQLSGASDVELKNAITESVVRSMLKKSTVLVLRVVETNKGPIIESFGTGFFISSRHILTNEHNIRRSGAEEPKILIASREFPHAVFGGVTVVNFGSQLSSGGIDLAVLKSSRFVAPSGQGLEFSFNVQEGDTALMAGYPQTTFARQGSKYKITAALDAGKDPERDSIPEVDIGETSVRTIQKPAGRPEEFPHDTYAEMGNSGSPLANACGQVIGVHFESQSDRENLYSKPFAISIKSVVEFLSAVHVDFRQARQPCSQG